MSKILSQELLPSLKLQEMYIMNVDNVITKFEKFLAMNSQESGKSETLDLKIIPGQNFGRFESSVDFHLAKQLYFHGQR